MASKLLNSNPKLESLMDERDHLQIRLSLAADTDRPDPHLIETAAERLAALNKEIAGLQRKPFG